MTTANPILRQNNRARKQNFQNADISRSQLNQDTRIRMPPTDNDFQIAAAREALNRNGFDFVPIDSVRSWAADRRVSIEAAQVLFTDYLIRGDLVEHQHVPALRDALLARALLQPFFIIDADSYLRVVSLNPAAAKESIQ
jgi:hypothetical protein